jgi:hypothetical protein
MAQRRQEEREQQVFAVPLLVALYSSLVIVALVALLNSQLGRSLDRKIDAPARTLIAGPVIGFAAIVFVACMVALIAPVYRRPSMKVAEIGGWLIPAWLVMGAMVLGAIQFALDHAH